MPVARPRGISQRLFMEVDDNISRNRKDVIRFVATLLSAVDFLKFVSQLLSTWLSLIDDFASDEFMKNNNFPW